MSRVTSALRNGGVEREWVGPDRAKPGVDSGVAQAASGWNSLPVGELGVVLPLAGDVRIDLEDMADIDSQDEGWPTVLPRQGEGIVLRLPLGGTHRRSQPREPRLAAPAFVCMASSGKMSDWRGSAAISAFRLADCFASMTKQLRL